MKGIKIDSIEQLNTLLNKGKGLFYILSNDDTNLRSKEISHDFFDNTYNVLDVRTSTEKTYTADEFALSEIGKTIESGNLYMYSYWL